MPDNEIITGRPYGGTAIIWNKDLKCKITPISLSTVRACAAIINVHNIDIMLCNVYMPTDTTYDQENVYIYNDVLNDIVRASMEHDCHQIILDGDLNTDFSRKSSLHPLPLTEFMTDQYMKCGLSHVLSEVDYTYRSKINDECSTLNHFIMTENIFNLVNKYNSVHEGDNLSDHSALQLHLDIPIAEQRQQSIFWHIIWKQCGSPSKGVVAELRRRTRSQYHQAAKKAKNNIEISKNTNAANALLEKRTKDFWSEIRKLKGKTKFSPSMIDNCHDEKDISKIFASKYNKLLNSVPSPEPEMVALHNDIDNYIT